ncbi:hypothetical protein Poli38472_002931 [Pythium oligandrum]|uniref:Alkaline phytoceramidase n=1 Tax=Pythium oligandrum TaxID=41045 RepID=A0A8K1C5L2_PYTOL|nr:hypothetical protein Poli38472_002931 [Pythium oligandrum]|eukprot:TMW57006.1 hypothetical protein Poli38472_002931 [Pythium oligandrum]
MASKLRVVDGFWGEPTATIDWCEPNYEHSFYVAEFWNTISNLIFVALGLYGYWRSAKEGFEWRFRLQFLAVMVTGFGSAMFHGTLQLVHQQCDETPMVWVMLIWIYTVFNHEIRELGVSDAVIVCFLTLLGVGFAVVHAIYRFTTLFQLLIAAMAISCSCRLYYHYQRVRDPRARAVAVSHVRSSLIALACWLVDFHLCYYVRKLPVNPQGHAWWHIFIGISSYHGPLFMQYVRLEELQRRPKVVAALMGIETIVVEQKKKAS